MWSISKDKILRKKKRTNVENKYLTFCDLWARFNKKQNGRSPPWLCVEKDNEVNFVLVKGKIDLKADFQLLFFFSNCQRTAVVKPTCRVTFTLSSRVYLAKGGFSVFSSNLMKMCNDLCVIIWGLLGPRKLLIADFGGHIVGINVCQWVVICNYIQQLHSQSLVNFRSFSLSTENVDWVISFSHFFFCK